MPAFFAFVHHLAAFTLVAAVAVEFVLIRGELSVASARRLQATDAVLGMAALLVLVVGLLRVFLFEKGAAYYFHSAPFLVKLRRILHWELAGALVILLCAALMARGIGYFGS